MNTCEAWAGTMRGGQPVACGRPARRELAAHGGTMRVCAEHYAAHVWSRARPPELFDQDAEEAP